MILGLAPMDGFTDCAMRDITQQIFDTYQKNPSAKDYGLKTNELYLWTEFMTADGYCAKPEAVIRHLMTSPNQKHLIAQIHGGNIETLLKTVKAINKMASHPSLGNGEGAGGEVTPFIGIELNLGCPAHNIMKSGGGSELLKDKKNTLEIIKTLSKASKIPFSIKTRTGINEDDKKAQAEFILAASDYCSMISIHGRTVKQVYSGECDRNFIYDIKKKANPNCKIIGNGGITSYQEALEKCRNLPAGRHGLDGIMIGQAAIGNPRIFTTHIPTPEEKRDTIIKHLDLMLTYNSDRAEEKIIIEFRKDLFQYIKGIPNSREFKVKISGIKEYHRLVYEIKKFLV